ncbi:type IV secretion system protein VirB2 [Malonomonas rubra DSM 5091]|jgi:type IV secretion system protein VirB2|uniref:Type IV secretion system protein VirB2 n=1 Tax=Malonomonas rubra DSM 5091 TaxID=1122189 RepID=A0A1M6KSG5_MALRU|nr:TrbC/VirB2 family protein [Malonomonas rubra]SHJ61794.1 type IV secretion system protein VirB2 [Malonomonas rubra DSM 5091]
MNQSATPQTSNTSTIVLLMALAFVLLPSLAFAGPIEDGVDWLLDLLTNGIARSLAIIGIVVLGYMAWAGRLTWGRAGQWIGGIVLVFGGAAITDLVIGAVS